MINFGVIILASWESFAVTFQFALTNGGPASIFYGSFLAGFGACAVGFSLAELASMYVRSLNLLYVIVDDYEVILPLVRSTVGLLISRQLLHVFGVYSKASPAMIIPPQWLTKSSGWITVAAWCFACSGPPSILANMITSLAIFNNESYVPQRWHTSLIMIAVMLVPFTFNFWFRRLLDTFESAGGILHIGLFIVFIVVLIVFGPRSNADFVFRTLVWEESGWNNKGISWGLGLLSMTFSVTGADSVLHMCT